MRKPILTILLFFVFNVSWAQINLVLNPSFEQYTTCPDNYDEATYCTHWTSIDSGWRAPDWANVPYSVPEYCNICATNNKASVPSNRAFYHYPRTGNGLMEFQSYCNQGDTFNNARDYLQQRLTNTLKLAHKYSVFFYITLTQVSIFAQNNIGAYFDDGSIDTTRHPGWVQSQYTPQIIDTGIVNDTLNWVKIEDTFTANGSEKFMTIGNFSKQANTHLLTLKSFTSFAVSWYLIDDVGVIDCSNVPHAGNDTLIHPGDSVFLGTHELLIPYTWYVLGGTTAIDSGGGTMVHPTVTTTYVLEQKLCGTLKYDTVKIRVWPDTVVIVDSSKLNLTTQQLDNLAIYPSPTKGMVTIEGVKGCTVSGYDVLGREVLGGIVAKEKEVLDLEQLVKGVYMVVVTDKVTGFRVVRQLLKE